MEKEYGKNYLFNAENGKLRMSNASINELVDPDNKDKYKNDDDFLMIMTDIPGTYNLFTMVDFKTIKKFPYRRFLHELRKSSDITNVSIIGRVFKDCPIDYQMNSIITDIGPEINPFYSLGIHLTNKMISSLNQFLERNLLEYEYFLNTYHFNPKEISALYDSDDEGFYLNYRIFTEEFVTKSKDNLYGNDFYESLKEMEIQPHYKYLYIMNNRDYILSNQIFPNNDFYEVFVYLPSLGLYQLLTNKQFKNLNKIQKLKIEIATVDDPRCFSNMEFTTDFESDEFIDMLELINFISIDSYLRYRFPKDRDELNRHDYCAFNKHDKYSAIKVSLQFIAYNVDMVLTEGDMFGYNNDHEKYRKYNRLPTARYIRGESLITPIMGYSDHSIWLLRLISKMTKIKLTDVRY